MDKRDLLEDKEEKGILASIQKIIASIFSTYDPDREKKRLLRDIKRDLKRRNKFYRVKGDVALPGLAKVFYEIYVTVGPAQVLFEKYAGSDVLKEMLIESNLSDKQKEIVKRLTPEGLRERAQNTDLRLLKDQVKEELVNIYSALDADTIRNVNLIYNNMLHFRDFINFDYYFLLKKFDSSLPEQDYNYNPRFEGISAEYLLEDLKDFLTVLVGINEQVDWDFFFNVLKEYRNIDVVSRPQWKKVLMNRRELLKTEILLNMVKHLAQDPYYKIKVEKTNFEIVESYLNKKKSQAESTLQEIFQSKKNQQIDTLLNNIFGTTAVSRTQYYTEKESVLLTKKSTSGYIYVKPVNYLKAFFLDYYKNDVRKLIDTMLIQGKWATSVMSQQLSDAYHKLLEYSDTLIDFDNALAEDGSLGVRVKRMMRSSAKDRSAQRALQDTLNDVNSKALTIINDSAQRLIHLGKYIKNLMADKKAMKGQMIINWKEIDQQSGHTIDEQMNETYMKIYYFIQLLQYFVKKKAPAPPKTK